MEGSDQELMTDVGQEVGEECNGRVYRMVVGVWRQGSFTVLGLSQRVICNFATI